MSITPLKCVCGSGWYVDRVLELSLGCPCCDPELGPSKEVREENYKKLVATPVGNELFSLFRNRPNIPDSRATMQFKRYKRLGDDH